MDPGVPGAAISLAICTYNRSRMLERTLKSIAAQQVDPAAIWSVIVVDNRSTDDTKSVVERWQRSDSIPGLTYTFEARQGVKFARQRAIRDTGAPLIAYVDDDCTLAPNWIREALTFMRDHPRAGAVGGRIHLDWEVPPADIFQRSARVFGLRDEGPVPLQLPATGRTYLGGAGLVLRREAVAASGWLSDGILPGRTGHKRLAGEDTELVLRIRSAGYELWYNPATELHHHVPEASLSFPHLCAMYQGIGAQWPILSVVAENHPPESVWGLGPAVSATALYAWRLARSAYAVARRRRAAEQRLALSYAWGHLLGAWSFVFQHGRGRHLLVERWRVRTATR